MPGLGDLMARSQAAQGMMSPGGDAIDPSAVMPEPTAEGEPQEGAPDIEAGASIIEAAADQMDPSAGDQVREHLNAIREIAANAAPSQVPEMPAEPPADDGAPKPPAEAMPA